MSRQITCSKRINLYSSIYEIKKINSVKKRTKFTTKKLNIYRIAKLLQTDTLKTNGVAVITF